MEIIKKKEKETTLTTRVPSNSSMIKKMPFGPMKTIKKRRKRDRNDNNNDTTTKKETRKRYRLEEGIESRFRGRKPWNVVYTIDQHAWGRTKSPARALASH